MDIWMPHLILNECHTHSIIENECLKCIFVLGKEMLEYQRMFYNPMSIHFKCPVQLVFWWITYVDEGLFLVSCLCTQFFFIKWKWCTVPVFSKASRLSAVLIANLCIIKFLLLKARQKLPSTSMIQIFPCYTILRGLSLKSNQIHRLSYQHTCTAPSDTCTASSQGQWQNASANIYVPVYVMS